MIHVRKLFAVAFLATPVLASLACSSSSSSSGSGQVSSLDGSKDVSQLGDSDKTQYCHDVYGYEAAQISDDDMKHLSCDIVASFAAAQGSTADAQKSACNQAYNDCLSKPLQKGDAGSSSSNQDAACAEFSKALATCKALTVSEYNACVSDQMAAQKTALQKNPCDSIGQDAGASSQSSLPASCQTVKDKCPQLLESTMGSATPTAG